MSQSNIASGIHLFQQKTIKSKFEQMEKDISVSRVLPHYNFWSVELLYLSIPCT